MTTLHHTEGIADDPNQKALEELARAIEWDVGQFALILARCNSASLRSHLIQRLRQLCSVEIREIVLDKSVKTLYSTIQAEFAEVQPQALMVCGLESVSTLDRLLTGANQVREEFRKNFHFPLVWWVTDEVLQKLIRLAPDLQSWFTTVEFEIATEELIHCIQETTDEVFTKVLDAGAGVFLDHAALNLGTGSTSCRELESARHELESRGVRLDSELEASLEFVLGRAADGSMEESRQHLERSLALWRQESAPLTTQLQGEPESQSSSELGQEQSAPLAPQLWGEPESQSLSELGQEQLAPQSWGEPESQSPPKLGDLGGKIPNAKSLERIGCVLHSLGLWWRSYAERHRAEYEVACSRAKEYFQQCVEVFEQAQRPELVAKFINALGEILQRLQQWDELEGVAKKALSLHQTYPHPLRLARVHGFLAEVHLAKSAWTEARHSAQTALSILASSQSPASDAVSPEQSANLDWVRSYHQGWYLFSLARAHSSLGQAPEAIANLETAAADTKPYYDPELYIRILEELRSLYFQQGDYLQAFHIKQDQRSIEQQYGFRAFVGAGRLQPRQEVANPVLSGIATQGTVAQEIAASGRQQDVNRLVERIGRSDHKLTVIQGQSGVGKSSLVQAGLIPALKQKAIGTRDVVPVLQQVYTDWVRELGKCLREALTESGNLESDLTPQPHREQGKGESGSPLVVGDRSFSEELGERSILDQLRNNAEQNLLTVLIFDQFEEFFFVCKDPIQRRQFYELMRDALDVPYTKVILSLREDYLYYLLECNNRLISLEVINNNILDKHILYYLGNFSVEDAKSVIQNLTQLAQFPLEPALIDALVQDLAGELGEVRPIELQVVGAQLQTEKISKLEQYQKRGPKGKLVERFLEEVVKDCGPGNEQIAKLVLYLLTDENNTRPLKTRADLELELDVEASKLDLVLEIFVKSRLVFQVPALPVDRYQLVHDYLVAFVRHQQSARLIAELEKEREQRKLSEAKLNQALKQQLRAARRATITLAGLLAVIGLVAVIATTIGINLYLVNLSSSSEQDSQIDYWVSRIKAGRRLQKLSFGTIPGTRLQVVRELNQLVHTKKQLNHLVGHEATVTSVSFSPDDKLLATVSEDRAVKLWNIKGRKLRTLKGHRDTVTSVSFSPDSKLLATASKDKTVILWSIDGREISTLKGHTDNVTSVSFSPDNKMLASASQDKTVRLWSLGGKELKILTGHTGDITSVSFSPNNKILASADTDDKVKLWSCDGRKINTIDNSGAINIRFSPDSKNLILTNKDGTIKIYNLNGTLLKNIRNEYYDNVDLTSLSPDNKLLAFVYHYDSNSVKISRINRSVNNQSTYPTDLGSHNDSITYLSFSHNGKMLASASKDKTVKLWSINSNAFKISDNSESRIYKVRFSPDGKIIAAAGQDNTVQLWSLGGVLLRPLQGDGSSVLNFSPDGKSLVTGSAKDIVRLWNLDGQEITLRGQTGSITSIKFSPDGKIIAAASDDKTIKLWKSSNGTLIKTLTGHTDNIRSISFSPDGKIIASIGAKNVVKLWRSDGTLIKTLQGHTESVSNVTFSPDSQIIATDGDDNVVKLWNRDGTPINILTGHPDTVTNVSFSPNSKIIASVSQGYSGVNSAIKLWSRNGTLLRNIDDYGIQSIRFSPDSSIIASINQDRTIKLWNLDGRLLTNFRKHNDSINDVSFSPDGQTIASASDDRTIKLWRRDGTIIKVLRGHSSGVKSVRFSPDSELIVSVSDDNMVKLWSRDGKELKTLQEGSERVVRTTNFINFSADSKIITFYSDVYISSGRNDNYTVKLWSRDGKQLKVVQGRNSNQISFSPNGRHPVSFSPNGRTIALATKENDLKLWNLDDGTLQATFKTRRDWSNNMSFSPDSKIIASADEDNTVKLWNRDGALLHLLKGHKDTVNSVSFSPVRVTRSDSDAGASAFSKEVGNILASASDDNTVKLWSSNGTLLHTLSGHKDKVNGVSFSPDGKIIVSASKDNTVKLWNRNGTPLDTLKHNKPVNSVSFSPDGKIVVSVSDDNTIKLWNTNGKALKTIEGNSGSPFSFSFSPNRETLAVLDPRFVDGYITLYIPNGFWFKQSFISSSNVLSDLSFSPDGKAIATASDDGVLVLSLDLDELLERGCDRVRDYLKNNPNVEKSDRKLCDDIPPQK